ncbi:uncharacterized protein ACA1_308130 [Acanthamoeba castellanii str. Neff]|uniref:Uncharacterized protein n=1 Tax=Acanthamoeba castellanii (strain ATCC 30010 / Neff) TaxID=1257118 RepID=L8HM18_ACACF|nr:uncharacterized protein ACA1_308130 [Acanthamoeba castellanii str. Neff]ELR25703.1 hypothetical protein ACA1_308130 [Acanthamoeba castellanii str. Neff]
MGIKLFLTGIELVVADDLRSPTSLPVRSVLHQLFVSTHMDAEFELVTKPPANAMIQPSQMYEVTVVGLEVQVPRTNSYILHPS